MVLLPPTTGGPWGCSEFDTLANFLGEARNRYTVRYLLYSDGTYYYAENGTTGVIDYGGSGDNGGATGTDGAAVFLAAMGALDVGRDYKQRIKVKGDWTFDNQINVPSYTVLDLDCRITSGDVANHGVFILDGVTDVEIYGGTLDGSRLTKTGGGAVFITGVSSRIKVVGVKIEAMAGHAIRAQTGTFEDIDVVGCHISDNAANTDGVYIGATASHVNIERNIFDTMPRAAIAVSGITDFEIVGNRLRDVARGINLETTVTEGVVSENIIDNTTATYGIQIRGTDAGTMATRVKIVSNKIASCVTQGIRVDQWAEEIGIDGNTITATTDVGIYVAGTGVGVVSISNNDCVSCALTGIRVDSEGVVVGNLVEDCGSGGANDGGIRLHDAANVSVWGNRAYNNDQYGIYETGTSDNNVIQNNEIRGSATTDCVIIGVSTAVHTKSFMFVYPAGGSAGWTAPVVNTSPGGIDIDANGEIAFATITLPNEVQQVIRIKIWAYSNVLEADAMRLQIVAHGATDNEAWNGNPIDVADHPSESSNFAANDVIYWLIDASNDAQVGTLAAQDYVEVLAVGEVAGGADCATDALFGGVEIDYV